MTIEELFAELTNKADEQTTILIVTGSVSDDGNTYYSVYFDNALGEYRSPLLMVALEKAYKGFCLAK